VGSRLPAQPQYVTACRQLTTTTGSSALAGSSIAPPSGGVQAPASMQRR
jgi:hypothetical protein